MGLDKIYCETYFKPFQTVKIVAHMTCGTRWLDGFQSLFASKFLSWGFLMDSYHSLVATVI